MYINTYQTRLQIGFKNIRQKWLDAPIFITRDKLRICGHPIMESWEDNYMKLLAEIATKNGGAILEVGFGMGISAKYIQKRQITKHIIIEANKQVWKTIFDFQKQTNFSIEPILGFWEDTIKTIPSNSIDGILFDTYPLRKKEIHCNHFKFFPEAYRILKPNGILTYYSDEVDNFSPNHLHYLQQAGFKKIDKKICYVNPPKECLYWKHNTILAPLITK